MNKKRPRTFTFIFIGILLFSGLFYLILFFTVVKPKQVELAQLDKEITMYENAVNRIEQQDNNEDNLVVLNDLLAQIPESKEPNSVLASLNTLANRNNVTINYIESLGPNETSSEQLNQASYIVEVGADNLRNVNQFMEDLLEGTRLTTVGTIEISKNEASVFARINITTYYTNK